MTPEEWEKVSEIYHQASGLKGDDRTAFLEKACDGDDALRLEVESLLVAESEAGDFISEPVVEAFAADILKSTGPSVDEMFGHYKIVSKIGSGGMGEVFLATDTKLGRKVAIKTLSSVFDGDLTFLKRFRNEARAAANLNHPNVATVYSVEEYNGRPFIAMEYVEGKTLDKLIPENGVAVKTFVEWFSPIARAIGHAHSKGVIHRDIKPGNLMVTNEGTPKILDFGLAFFQSGSDSKAESLTDITKAGQILGTPSYMSPEQAEGKEIDRRSDIFSLGVVMYEAITGKRPFTGDSHAEIVSNLLKADPEPISQVRPETPEVVSVVIGKCLRKPVGERYQSMDDVSDAFAVLSMSGRSSRSFESFQRRLFRESRPTTVKWIPVAAIAVIVAALLGWYYFSSGSSEPPVNFATMTIKRLSQSNNVGYTQLSPDGKSIAYATIDSDDTRALWIRRVDDRNALQIVPPHRLSFWGGLAISEDGGQVFYLLAGRSATHGSLYRVSSLGGPPRKLVELANDVGGISPDGQRILFVRYGETARILAVNTSDGSAEQIIHSAPQWDVSQTNFRDPQFSPDGKSVYYIKYERIDGVEYWSLIILPMDSGTETLILKQKERMGEIAVLRDGTGLLTTAIDPASNIQQLYHVSLPDGTMTRVTNDLNFYYGISVDREGRNIVSAQRSDQYRVWVGEASGLASLKPVTSDQSAFRYVDWTPDGRIVYDAFENNRTHICIADADGKNVQQLTESGTDDAEPRVSGDGRFIVFSSKRSGRNQVHRMNIDGSNQILLADVPGVTQLPRFAADGLTVVFDWLRDLDRVLGKVPIAGGNVEELPQFEEMPLFNAFYWAMSPDGKYVAYSFTDEAERRTKIAVKPVNSSETVATFNIWPSLVFKWMPDSRGVYYRERELGYQPETKVFMSEIGKPEPKLLYSAAPELIVDLTYSRDGKKVAVVRGSGTSNAIMLSSVTAK